jgi:Zn finger protein HypA/HybF involved in hydrogenase expression
VSDPFGIPWLVVIVFALIPIAVAALLGAVVFRRMTPLVFRCLRCRRDFYQAAHRAFPAICPLCRARDWNCSAAATWNCHPDV